jgi:hypothetical protein
VGWGESYAAPHYSGQIARALSAREFRCRQESSITVRSPLEIRLEPLLRLRSFLCIVLVVVVVVVVAAAAAVAGADGLRSVRRGQAAVILTVLFLCAVREDV